MAEVRAECQAQWDAPEFAPIRNKVELRPTAEGGKLRFNESYATAAELPLIAKFRDLLDECGSRTANIVFVTSPSIGAASIRSTNAVVEQLENLRRKRITWGEFNTRRYAIINGRAETTIRSNQRRHEADMRDAQRSRERMLEDATRRNEEAMRRNEEMLRNSTPKQTTTDCTPNGFGGFNCHSTQW
ncbi:hypothetical protein L1889_00550 [Paenalcaligenes niemegkensis]|uniref:hypothetical protein n=1 Tax=Paenalcaligenes niemegkensis TaxID=2895469 RepID=UPI001EE8668A|nr:hypothetical protein [Paenalcaligenes niemegkensis]MCQ9615395.1 hypothetical protein [Paenalcaligenes niemegkensis]